MKRAKLRALRHPRKVWELMRNPVVVGQVQT